MTHPPAARSWLPWRSARLGWLAFAATVVVGGPLFLRMPLWIDVTLYDVAARNILSGGVHYRDVFDTNPPGFTWLLCVIRPLLGPSIEAVRAVDLLVVGAVGALLLRAARRAGATPAGVAFGAAGMAGFYLFISEFNHAQRDTWMMLPALVATAYRLRRQRASGAVFGTAVLEGLIWGVGVWIKPHVLPIAVAAWAVTLTRWGGGRRARADLAGVLLGGLLAGATGAAWLVGSGTWPHFWNVFTTWNTAYTSRTFAEFGSRIECQLYYFPPWSLFILLAVPLAVRNLWNGFRADAPAERAVLAALYLAWVASGMFLQRQFHYVHVPETLLMIALFAANRWSVTVLALLGQWAVIGWLAVRPAGDLTPWRFLEWKYQHVVWAYPDRSPNRLPWWPDCVRPHVSGAVRNGVAFQSDYFAGIDSEGLEEVAEFLRQQGVRDGEVLAFNDSPHVLYLMLDVKPGIRFMHFSTVASIDEVRYGWVQAELEERMANPAPAVRFVVSDIRRLSIFAGPGGEPRFDVPGPGPHDHLPAAVDTLDDEFFKMRDLFPLDQPTVFRSGNGRGRYVVHVPTRRPIGYLFWPW